MGVRSDAPVDKNQKEIDYDKFDVPVDENRKCAEFKPFKFYGFCLVPHCGSRRTNPHMRGFWAATIAFHMAFFGWFAFAPLMGVVRKDIGICDNADEVALDVEGTECVCEDGCRKWLNDAKVASFSFDVFMRFMMGAIIERLGPRNTDVVLMSYGVVVVACSATVTSGTGLVVIRFFVSAMGSTFVVNQFWNSIIFTRSVMGTANATAGGWGNTGGGTVQIIMVAFYSLFHDSAGASLSASWRLAMIVPCVVYACVAVWVGTCSQDTPSTAGNPTGKFDVMMMGKKSSAGREAYMEVLKDYRIILMFFHYGACFGCEIMMHNTLHSYFHDVFHMDMVAAGALAMAFGAMNLFARTMGGMLSDWANKKKYMTGRLWVHFICLFVQGVTLFLFASVTPEQGVGLALFWLCVFSVFQKMACGTSYSIVPFMFPKHLAVVSALVGAGGTLGAVVASATIYRFAKNDARAMQYHALYVLFWSFTVFALKWDHLGSMWHVVPPKPTGTSESSETKGPVKVSTSTDAPAPPVIPESKPTTDAPADSTEGEMICPEENCHL